MLVVVVSCSYPPVILSYYFILFLDHVQIFLGKTHGFCVFWLVSWLICLSFTPQCWNHGFFPPPSRVLRLGDLGCTEALLDDHVAALGAQGHGHGIGQSISTCHGKTGKSPRNGSFGCANPGTKWENVPAMFDYQGTSRVWKNVTPSANFIPYLAAV